MKDAVHIGEAAKRLGVSPEHLRVLEREGRIPAAHRDFNGRVYSELDLALLKALGIGTHPRKLKTASELLQAAW